MASDSLKSSKWLLSPSLDLLLIANIGWPLLVLVAWLGSGPAQADWQFLQVYFLTTPHRWLTLFLVWGDAKRRESHWVSYLGVLLAVVLVCGLVQAGTGALTCLVAADFLWNIWHFAAQHHGVYRIYSSAAYPSGRWTERMLRIGIRGSIVYVALRASGWVVLPSSPGMSLADVVAVASLSMIVVVAILRYRVSMSGSIYLVSISMLYLAWLLAEICGFRDWILPLAIASAWVHASEYMAVCSWSVRNQVARSTIRDDGVKPSAAGSSRGLLGQLAPVWAATILTYLLVVGLGGWFLSQRVAEIWLALNLVAAFLHYAYDGMIWKRGASKSRGEVAVGHVAV
ncbi:hypothetical protein Plim_2899 [Planctopirus limnophila DSM 3776]|uniref:Transmembrane protein n=1 Tax=Planctopirus limnophila (strain ATCC 43296 / DSM 3776 / IFAM 1008 / Mu 290) TaxID=521674 RepID=D5SRZ7_PLAL2|nr:hypothetical protein [Planctopirus limnophila]ADG68721.1 hypothetical protein Plim_2899 [Planctopirus limnophila DSM 3776]